jgi:hypothetical protein
VTYSLQQLGSSTLTPFLTTSTTLINSYIEGDYSNYTSSYASTIQYLANLDKYAAVYNPPMDSPLYNNTAKTEVNGFSQYFHAYNYYYIMFFLCFFFVLFVADSIFKIFKNKALTFIQYSLLMINVMVSIFLIATLAYTSGIGVSQECSIMQKAINSGDSTSQSYIYNWVGLSFQSTTAASMAQACLYSSNVFIGQYLYNVLLDSQIITLTKNVNKNAQLLINLFASTNYYPSLIYTVNDSLYTYEYNPVNQSLPQSQNQLDLLNSRTQNSSPNCLMQDKWVYSFDNNSCGDFPLLYVNSTFNQSYVGPKACLALWMNNETTFDIRYNSTFLSSCDAGGNIKAAFTPLSSYASTSMQAFSYVSSSYMLFLNSWMETVASMYNIMNYTTQIEYYTNITYNSMTNYTANQGVNQCLNIINGMKALELNVCKWGAALSWYSLVEIMIGAFTAAFATMRLFSYKSAKESEDVLYQKVAEMQVVAVKECR